MNKAIKGSIAAGAAGILLLGGAGTLAQWRDSTEVDAGALSTGQLELALGPGAWNDWTSGAPVPITTISGFKLVPGDTLIYTTTATITAVGNNLAGKLAVANDVSGLPAGTSAVVTVQENEDNLTAIGNNISFIEAGTYTVGVTLRVDFDFDFETTEGLTNQGATLDLNNIGLALEQQKKYA